MFHDRFVSQDELTEFLGGRGHLRHAVPQAGADHVGHAGVRGRRRARPSSRRRTSTRARCWPTAAACWCRGGIPTRSRARSSALLGDDARRCQAHVRARAPPTAATWRGPPSARLYVQSFARAQRERHGAAAAAAFQAQTLASRPAGWPEMDLRAPARMTDDTGILQHAVFSVPRYDEGYCLDDNARALLLMALVEEAGTDDPAVGARARRALPRVRELRVRSIVRALPELHVVRARSGSSRSDPRTATAARCGRSAPSSAGPATRPAEPGRRAVPCRPAGRDRRSPARARGLRAARHRRVPARVSGRQQRRGAARRARASGCSACFTRTQRGRVALVRGLA